MKLSAKSEYACLSLIVLSENYTHGKGYMRISDIAEAKKNTEKIPGADPSFSEEIPLRQEQNGSGGGVCSCKAAGRDNLG